MSYSMLFLDHVAFSKGALFAETNKAEKTITFSYPPDLDVTFLTTQLFSNQKAYKVFREQIPLNKIQNDYKTWASLIRFDGRGFHISENLVKHTTAYTIIMDWLNDKLWPELLDTTLLNKYKLEDFKKFYAALFINCQYWCWLEEEFDSRFGLENALGSGPIRLSDIEIINRLSEMSGVTKNSIKAILKDLTFDVSNIHSNLLYQPFVHSNSGKIYSLPRLIIKTDPARLLSGALNKGKGQKVYDGIVQTLEQSSLDFIETQFKILKLTVLREQSLKNEKGEKITPDFIVFDERNRELLIADYKHALTPFGPSEVYYKIKEVKKGLKQIQRYLNFVKENYPILQKLIDNLDSTVKIYALLLFRWPMPIPINKTQDIEIIDWFSVKKRLNKKYYKSISSLITWIKCRPDVPDYYKSLSQTYFDVQVADWKYRTTILAGGK
jgi:hypothetical protein